MTLKLDHLVVNSHFALDSSAELFRALGFNLTPKGFHSLGSVNHLIMFSDHYLELIGLPAQGEPLREELLDSPPGIDGLVFASSDAQASERSLRDAGFQLQPLQHFSRAVVSGEARGEARFTTLRLAPGSFSAGRVYFCQHHTPEWVWRDEWLQAGAISGVTVVAQEVEATRARFARLGESELLNVIGYPQWNQQYGQLLTLTAERESLFACIHISGHHTPTVLQTARRLNLPWRLQNGKLRVAIPALTLVLEFDDA